MCEKIDRQNKKREVLILESIPRHHHHPHRRHRCCHHCLHHHPLHHPKICLKIFILLSSYLSGKV
jgi:hypothetical protein